MRALYSACVTHLRCNSKGTAKVFFGNEKEKRLFCPSMAAGCWVRESSTILAKLI